MAPEQILEAWNKALTVVGGCGDGNCVVLRPKGMHTNGGCRCHEDRMKSRRVMSLASYYKNKIESAMADQVQQKLLWTNWKSDLDALVSCGDTSCFVKSPAPGTVVTNGGCRCNMATITEALVINMSYRDEMEKFFGNSFLGG